MDRSRYASAAELKRGAYILAEAAKRRPEIILIATGSEVGLIVEAQRELEKQNIPARLVSMPSWELFDAQTEEYRKAVFPSSIRARLAVEAGATQGWHRYVGDVGDVIGLDHFGASAPGPVLCANTGLPLKTSAGEPWPCSKKSMPNSPKCIGIAADHGGFESKQYLDGMLRAAHYEVIDYGDSQPKPDDDYPDFVIPLARAVARGEVDRGVAICGSGVGACIAANKVPGVRACLIHESLSARQGVEDDDMNVICLGGRVIANMFAWELVKVFLEAQFSGLERHRRRVTKIASLERSSE